MFRKKLVVLSFFVMLPMSCPGWAADTLPETQILIDRAHYWDKLGRADMAIPIWQELLQVEPNNAEALAAMDKAGNEKSPEPGHQASHDATQEPAEPLAAEPALTTGSAAMPVTYPVRTPDPVDSPPTEAAAPVTEPTRTPEPVTAPEPIPLSVENRTSPAASAIPLQPVVIPAPIDNSTTVKQVEDWPDLYQGTIAENTLPDKTATEPAVPLQTDIPDVRPDVDGSHDLTPLPDSENRVPLKSAKAAAGILQIGEVAPVQPSHSASAPSERRIGQDEKISGFFERQMDVAPPSSPTTPKPGGQLTVENNPAALTERAAYWESHGRRDLADKIRKQSEQIYPKQAKTVNTGQIIMGTYSRPLAQDDALNDAKPPAPDANEKAKYWAAHGRSDLADNTPSAKPAAAERHEINVPTERQMATLPVVSEVPPATSAQAPAHPTAQELNERAQYWETHGRSDLGVQIRQKLQLMETDQLTGGSARTGRDTGQHAEGSGESAVRTALEDSLLKNPNSLKTRLDLAKIYLAAGEIAKARIQIDSVLTASPDLPEAIFASARLYAAQRLWPETLYALEKVSPVSRTEEMAQLQKTAWAHMQIDRADALVRQGKNQEAELLLRRVAAELAVSDNQSVPPEPPPLWKNEISGRQKAKH